MLKPLQKLRKSLNVVWVSLSVCGLSACARIEIKDAEFCGDKGALGASCFHTLTNESRELSKNEWDEIRFGQVCSSAQTFAEWKASILKLCKVSKACTYEEKKLLNKFMARIEKHAHEAEALK